VHSTSRLRLEPPSWRNFTVCGWTAGTPEGTPPAGGDSGSAAAGNGSSSAGDGEEEIRDPKARVKSLTEERDRHYAARQEAERKLNERLAADAEEERKKLSDAERTQRDLAAKQQQADSLVETNRRLSLQNAFLIENTVTWHSPADALALADLSAVETADDGTIKNPDAVKAAITKLAKDKAYLVKTDAAPAPPKDPPPGSGTPPQAPPPPGNGLDTASLAKKYPALRGHV